MYIWQEQGARHVINIEDPRYPSAPRSSLEKANPVLNVIRAETCMLLCDTGLNIPPRSGRDLSVRELMSDEGNGWFGWGSREPALCGIDGQVECSDRKHVSVFVDVGRVKIYFFNFIPQSI